MLRFASVPYFNAAPLVHFLPEICPEVTVSLHPPCDLHALLIQGRVDAALLPIVDLSADNQLEMAGDLGICADGKVQSVRLQCNKPLTSVKTIGLDPESRTSNRLARLLLHLHFKIYPEFYYPDNSTTHDANVLIGDRALKTSSSEKSFDLAEEWKKMTGLPFVFAAWSIKKGHPDNFRIKNILHRAWQKGSGSIPFLADRYSQQLGLDKNICQRYLSESIHYQLGPEELESVKLFNNISQNNFKRRIS